MKRKITLTPSLVSTLNSRPVGAPSNPPRAVPYGDPDTDRPKLRRAVPYGGPDAL